MNRPLALLTLGVVLSLTLLSYVNGSISVDQNFNLCSLGNRAGSPGQVQINVCNNYYYGNGQGPLQYEIKSSNYESYASGGCNGGRCSYPTVVGVSPNSYLILRYSPNYISGLQIIEPDSNGNTQLVWVPYNQINNYQYNLNCNPYYQVCFSQGWNGWNNCGYGQCSAVIVRIAATPFTVNVFF